MTVQVTISDIHGEFAKNEETKNITFPAFDNSESFEVQTNRFRYINENGAIKVEIDDGTGYDVFSGANNNYRREMRLTVTNKDDSPLLSIISDGNIDESENAKFFIISDTDNVTLSVNYTIEQVGDFLHSNFSPGPKKTTPLSFRKSSNCLDPCTDPLAIRKELVLTIVDDSTHESNGQVTVTLNIGEEYDRTLSNFSATVNVNDNDPATLSIESSSLNVDEGAGTTSIEVTTNSTTSETFRITYSTSIVSGDTAEQNDFTDPSTQPAQTVSITSGTPGIVRIPIKSDTIREGDETFSVIITAGSRLEFSGGATNQNGKGHNC